MKNLTILREGGREASGVYGGPCLKIYILIIIGKQMKILCLKFHKNRTINEEFDFFEEEGEDPRGVRGLLFIHLYLNYVW